MLQRIGWRAQARGGTTLKVWRLLEARAFTFSDHFLASNLSVEGGILERKLGFWPKILLLPTSFLGHFVLSHPLGFKDLHVASSMSLFHGLTPLDSGGSNE